MQISETSGNFPPMSVKRARGTWTIRNISFGRLSMIHVSTFDYIKSDTFKYQILKSKLKCMKYRWL